MLLKSADNACGFVAKVADFGLARHMEVEERVQSNRYGTITHCPPELLLQGIFSKVQTRKLYKESLCNAQKWFETWGGIEERVRCNHHGTMTNCPPELLLEGPFSKVGRLANELSMD